MKESKVVIGDLDVFYISYDEPAKEEHWANLMMKFPFAKRVDGVKGFDNAHKECARQSETSRFITIDGDNIVDEKFFDLEITFPGDTDLANSIVSWSAKNMVNGLVYGNGGIKCWPVDLVLEMKTHENAEDETKKVDFCWDLNYIQMNNIYSEVYNAGSPFQAFRAGYREGVKMSLDEGKKVPVKDFQKRIRELGRINDKIERLKEERSKFDLWDVAKNCNKKLKLNWHYSTGVQAPYKITGKSKPVIKWDSWGLYENSIKRDIMMNTFKEDIDVNKFVDAIFGFYKDLTPDELVARKDSGRTRERITYES